MSLHRKIIAWFVVFASLTILVFGLGDYIQSSRALQFALEVRAGAVAQQVAGEIDRRYDRLEAELLAVGYAVGAGARNPPLPPGMAGLQVERRGVPVFRAPGDDAPAADGCTAGDVPFRVEFRDERGVPYTVSAGMPADEFFAGVPAAAARFGRRGVTAVLAAIDGGVVHDPACGTPETAALAARVAGQVAGGAVAGSGKPLLLDGGDDGSSLVAAMAATRQPWVAVVAMDLAEFAGPFLQMRRQYFGTMTAVLLGALLVVFWSIRGEMRRLTAISQAADAIGHGRFDVWLPPPTGDEIGRVSLALGRMTERLSSTLRQIEVSRSMAAVGELATYLSHEIRNPLSSIRLNLQMLKRDLRSGTVPDDGEQVVSLCLSELQRLDDVVKTVLEVGRTGPRAAGSCSAHDVIGETLRVMQRKFAAAGVEVTTELRAPESAVAMGSAALRGIVMNLVLNGVDAVADLDERRITVSTRLLEVPGDDARFELRVADNGPGVPAHLRERIFDPFFTTKTGGNGIGLPTALRAVQECAGVLRYEPSGAWGSGAEFVLELPLAERVETTRELRQMAAAGA